MSTSTASETNKVIVNDNSKDNSKDNSEKDFLAEYEAEWNKTQPEKYTLGEYLELCKKDKSAYASVHERMLAAIGEPVVIDTSKDPELGRIHSNKKIVQYPAFKEFYGMEETISSIVSFLKSAAQGLEQRKQILYLLGPVGGGKSSIAERLKDLIQDQPFYALAYKGEISPINESPLGLFNAEKHGPALEEKYGIKPRYLRAPMSPWTVKRLAEAKAAGTGLRDFSVVKLYPSILSQVAVSKTEPGDENNQDISALVGKVDIRKLEEFAQNDPDAYSFSGGLCKGNRGIMEFVEMFKAPLKVLNPLLTATQDGNFNGTESISAIPFDGIVFAHSNESEWEKFRNNKDNEAFIDRVCVVKVPYALRVMDEVKVYKKLVTGSDLADGKAAIAPKTLEMLAEFAILTRLKEVAGGSLYSKMRVYNGENLKDSDPRAKSLHEYKDDAGVDEGMDGLSTRFAYKALAATFNFNAQTGGEIAADPVHLMRVLEKEIREMQLPKEKEDKYLGFLHGMLKPKYKEFIENEIKAAYIESYSTFGQNIFDRYVSHADAWTQDHNYPDPSTGLVLDKEALNKALEKIEKPAGISNPKDFRNEIVNFVLRVKSKNGGKNPDWTSYEKMRQVIEKTVFANVEEMLPVISFGAKAGGDEEKKHANYVSGMKKRGYTEQQVRLVTDWYVRHMKA